MSSFLQSVEWEHFQKSLGRKTWRANGNLIIRHDLPFGFNYLYSPHPVFSDEQHETGDKFLNNAKQLAQKEKSIFLKVDILYPFDMSHVACRMSHSIQPRKTVVLDIQKSENELLRGMHEKTRYNIRLAEKRGVNVFSYTKELRKNLPEVFFRLLEETAQRDKFHPHERRYYEKLLAIDSKSFKNKLFFAEYERKIVAAALVNFYRGSTSIDGAATYLHGASSREHREVMAPQLLHWRIIQEAKKLGFAKYDFWGIDDVLWPGLTRFKKGFGGRVVEYPKSIDVIYGPMRYKIYKFARKLR